MNAPIHECDLVTQLEGHRDWALEWYEQRCEPFTQAVLNVDDAVSKIDEELLGPARALPPYEFNGRVSDLMAEIAAVAKLFARRQIRFRPLIPVKLHKGLTMSAPDFEFCAPFADQRGYSREGYLEVKNVRAPLGINTTFSRFYKELALNYPALSQCHIRLEHRWDNTLNDEQTACIHEFLLELSSAPVFGRSTLVLPPDIEVTVGVNRDSGGVWFMRPFGPESPAGPYYDLEAFKQKLTDTITKGRVQLSAYPARQHILALNLETPMGVLEDRTINLIHEIVVGSGRGEVECFLLQYHSPLRGLVGQ